MNCPICGGAEYWSVQYALNPKIERWRREEGDETAYEWRLCRRCANAYPSHQPDLQVVRRIWLEHKTKAGLTPVEQQNVWQSRRVGVRSLARRSFSIFAPLAAGAGKRFLDIACGFGETVKTFGDQGWEAEGIDVNSSIAQVHQEMGLRVRYGQIEEMDVEAGYHIIHIAHAIYFITNPMRFLTEVRQRLAVDGIFCIVLSNFFANHDPSLPSYAHTFFPTAASIRYALALAGFQTILCKRVSGSTYVAARPTPTIEAPSVSPAWTYFLLRTKPLRYALIGRPYLAMRQAAKYVVGRG